MFKNFKLSRDIGIDLGTATVQVYVQDKGIVIREPSVVAIDKTTDKVIKVGREAQDLVGRAPDGIFTLRPLKDGDINEYEVTYKMLQYFIRRASGNTLLPPRIMLALPATLSEVEERAVHEAAAEAGARKSFIVPSPVAAALGAGLDVRSPIGNMIVDIGGGAKLSGLDKLIHRVTGIKTYVADDPEDCVVKGAAAKLESINKYSIEG